MRNRKTTKHWAGFPAKPKALLRLTEQRAHDFAKLVRMTRTKGKRNRPMAMDGVLKLATAVQQVCKYGRQQDACGASETCDLVEAMIDTMVKGVLEHLASGRKHG